MSFGTSWAPLGASWEGLGGLLERPWGLLERSGTPWGGLVGYDAASFFLHQDRFKIDFGLPKSCPKETNMELNIVQNRSRNRKRNMQLFGIAFCWVWGRLGVNLDVKKRIVLYGFILINVI